MRERSYDQPGDKLTSFELCLFDVEKKKRIETEVDKIDLHYPRLYWARDGRHFAYEKVDRGHQRLRIIGVDSQSGKAFDIIDEKTDTFIWTAHTENLALDRINWLPDTDEAVYVSERDGWRHLYLVDTKKGGIKNQITKGEYVVRGIDRIDEKKRQIWFHASGNNSDQDPYFLHYYRVNFDGRDLLALTEANGNHSVQFSPDRKFFIDTYSRVDAPPKHELRSAADGKLVCPLEEADVSELLGSSDYHPLEVFVTKGRDGKTDIWGVICRPRDFDPNKKYPIIESIYAGPQGSFVPKSFGGNRYAEMADLGFIVVQIDGMGTANRSKAFHDVCWHNIKDAGFPDRILWIKAAAEKYPYMDLTRIGIHGNSAGGQNAAAGVLFHPEFYKVAVASCGCHDNRMDKASWNEQWMGYPVGPQYSECSNIDNAHRLEGKLMLIVGELDDNVPPESTFRFVDALIKAGKDFDLLVVPGGGHGIGGEYGVRRLRDFFVRHLLNTEPPDRNAPVASQVADSVEQQSKATSRGRDADDSASN
jgi:dipeptidyl aminopeptidase/acylaminoacyl peptidase